MMSWLWLPGDFFEKITPKKRPAVICKKPKTSIKWPDVKFQSKGYDMGNQINVRLAVWAGALVLGVILSNGVAQAAGFVEPEEMLQRDQWAKEHLLDAKAKIPFSFLYNRQASEGLLSIWEQKAQSEKLDAVRTQHSLRWTDPGTGLEVRCVAVEYADYPVVEWTVYFKNTSKQDTPILEDIQGLDTQLKRSDKGEFVLNGVKGDFWSAASYEPYRLAMGANTVRNCAPPPRSGKSCDGRKGWPYYNLQIPGGGIILAIGWPGQWASSFVRDDANGLRIKAGQELTHMLLKPGEEIRTPLTVMLFWQGTDIVRSQNIWRRWYMAHNIPRVNGQCPGPMVSAGPSGLCEQTEENCRKATDAIIADDSTITHFWVDAGWYPCDEGPYEGKKRWLNTGTWDPDPKRLPNGFREFSDKLHAKGKKFILWFEPERVGHPDSWLGKNHPEWLLPGQSHGSLLDEGNPEALRWLIDHVDGMIKSEGMDWYREDMNGGGPLPCWRKNDTPDRQGITENFYVQGHLYFWDELRWRNPGLFIDSCASGGRRNDIETMRRAVPLLRSDFTGRPKYEDAVEGNQGHTYGLSFWLPFQGTGVGLFDKYSYRSFYLPSLNMGGANLKGEKKAAQKQAHTECMQIAPYILFGDYYPLTDYSLQLDQWIAWQFDRPELGAGVVQAFRRENCTVTTMTFKLYGLEPNAVYTLTNLDVTDTTTATGSDLMNTGLTVNLSTTPGSAVIIYSN